MEGNNYWEQSQKQGYVALSEDEIVSRIQKCQFVIDKLEKDELWQIIMTDVSTWVKSLDTNWQYTYNDKLYEMRVLKHACMHLMNLKEGYMTDWKVAQEELERRRNPEVIERDMEN